MLDPQIWLLRGPSSCKVEYKRKVFLNALCCANLFKTVSALQKRDEADTLKIQLFDFKWC